MAANRAEAPKRFLDASVIPVENALRYRAGRLQDENDDAVEHGGRVNMIKAAIAEELLALAEELHHW